MGECYSSPKGGVLFPSEEHRMFITPRKRVAQGSVYWGLATPQRYYTRPANDHFGTQNCHQFNSTFFFPQSLSLPMKIIITESSQYVTVSSRTLGRKSCFQNSREKLSPKETFLLILPITAELAKQIGHERLQVKSRFSSLDAGVPSSVREPECSRRMKPQASAEQAAAYHRQSCDVH